MANPVSHEAVINAVTKFVSLVFIFTLSVGIEIVVLIYGWGLTPKSWWWIIGVGIFALTVVTVIRETILGRVAKAARITEVEKRLKALEVEEEARKARANASKN